MARLYRRSDICRRHPPSPRSQRSPHRSRRREPETPTLQIDPKGLTTDLQLVKNPASRVPASQATSSRIAGRHHLGISGRLRRNLQEHEANRAKLVQWYWNGVFGEKYGSAVETRIALDFTEVPAWLGGGSEPSTVSETIFRADRLKTMRMRLSAAYKGMNALLMKEGAQDFRSGQKFDHTVFFGENVDIHHVFPQDWCKKSGIKPQVYDSIINKTPLSYRTNRIIGGVAPSEYLAKLEKGNQATPSIEPIRL